MWSSPGETTLKGNDHRDFWLLCWFWKSFLKVTGKWLELHPREVGW